jgi:hypothetical protein
MVLVGYSGTAKQQGWPIVDQEKNHPPQPPNDEDALAKNSNKTAWNQCKWKGPLEGPTRQL